jgi:hypothetical protein
MNKDTLNSNDSEQAPIALETQAGELNSKMTRRRLLKGAAFGAPVILTLRSGALMAAASCNTGIKGYVADSLPERGDYCVQLIKTCDGGAGRKVNSESIGNGTPATLDDTNADGFITGDDYTYTCPAPPDGSGYTYSIILSSAAWTSLTII